jgi:uncharacterized membrane protein YhaH (DUF805 family)
LFIDAVRRIFTSAKGRIGRAIFWIGNRWLIVVRRGPGGRVPAQLLLDEP